MRREIAYACCAALFVTFHCPALAQVPAGPSQELNEDLESLATTAEEATDQEKNRDLIIVPIPHFSPALGAGLTLAAALFYNPNKAPEPWITGVGVMRTRNKSWGIGAAHKMSLADDKYRFAVLAGYADVNVDFYGIGPEAGDRDASIQLNDRGYAALAQGQMRVARHVYIGPRFEYLSLKTSVRRDRKRFPDAEIPRIDFDSQLVGLGLALSYDSRDSALNPRKGVLVAGTAVYNSKSIGSDFTHDKYSLSANLYQPVTRTTVVAARASMCSVSKGGPFYDLCLYGMSSDLRGYEAGRYRNKASWAAQVEVRQHLFGRFGAVAFGGVGESADRVGAFGSGKWLPAAGVGLRYQPSKDTPVNLRVDYAWGRDSRALYVSLGEAF